MDDLGGQVLKGYELHNMIGKGGLGAVYSASQTQVGREVAIKIILPQFANHPDFIRRFEFEARLVARLEHPHIVPLYDFWREPNGAYLVMRLLRSNLREALNADGFWAPEAVAYLLDQIAAALTVAHRNGVIHRDIKPDNILLDEDGNAYLADFGIAKDLHLGDDRDTDAVVGSPAYLSPEQIKSNPVMPQTDLYGLGIVLYEVLAGAHPFAGARSTDMLYRHLNEPLPLLARREPGFPTGLDDVLQRATAKDPAGRFSSAMSLAAAFRQAINKGSTRAPGQAIVTRSLAVSITARTTPSGGFEFGTVAPENPYKGLRPFTEADANRFFGRETVTIQLLTRLSEPGSAAHFLAVVGPSGSGKTSLVKAGLVPVLRDGALPGSERWFIQDMLPGPHPLHQFQAILQSISVGGVPDLAEALANDPAGLPRIIHDAVPGSDEGTQLVLIIDQFEELFLAVESEDERRRFIDSLLSAVNAPGSCLYVIVTLRADHYDKPLRYPVFGELVRRRTEVVLPLSGADLERAITGPAESVQVLLEPGLVEMIKADIGSQPGVLPLLQYALTELFEHREERQLTRKAYQDIGGVLGALARRAEELYDDLDAAGREAARQMFLRLAYVGDQIQGARRRVPQSELVTVGGDPAAMEHVLDAFGKHRLLTFDRDPITRQPTVEVAHEALIWEWGRLQGWIDASREELRQQRRLQEAVAEWLSADRDPSFLATGRRLEEFEAWAATTDLAFSRREEAYLRASMSERADQLARAKAQRTREARLKRRSRSILWALVAVMAAATLVALGLTAFALYERQVAQTERDNFRQAVKTAVAAQEINATSAAVAARNEAKARSLALAASAQLALNEGDVELALALSLEANAIDNPPPQAQLILAGVAYAPGIRRAFEGHTDDVKAVAFSPDGQTAISGASDKQLILWDVNTGAEIRRFAGHTAGIWDAAFTPDGKQVLSASEDRTIILWDIATGEIVRRFEGHTAEVRSLAVHPDGHTFFSGAQDRRIIQWDLATGAVVRRFEGHRLGINAIAVSPAPVAFPSEGVPGSYTGYVLLSGSLDHTAILWDIATGSVIYRFKAHHAEVTGVAFSPDGRAAASASFREELIAWDLRSGAVIWRAKLGDDTIWDIEPAADGGALFLAGDGGDVLVWNAATGAAIRRASQHRGAVWSVALSPDGRLALAGGDGGDLLLMDTTGGAEIRRLAAGEKINGVALDPGYALFGTDKGNLYLWDVARPAAPRRLASHESAINAVAFRPDGRAALFGTSDKLVILWDIVGGGALQRMAGHTDKVRAVAFSPDGRFALSGASDHDVLLWDLETGAMVRRLAGHTDTIWSVAFSADGSRALSGAGDGSLILWDLASGTEIRRLEGHSDQVRSVAFDPAAPDAAVSASFDGSLILWDLASGAPVRRFLGHNAAVFSAAFSPDGKMIVSGGADGSLILWDAAAGQAIRRLVGHTDGIRSVAFSPGPAGGGYTVLSGSADNTLRLWWAHNTEELIAWTRANRSAYIRDLTCQERERYDPAARCDATGHPANLPPND